MNTDQLFKKLLKKEKLVNPVFYQEDADTVLTKNSDDKDEYWIRDMDWNKVWTNDLN